MRNSMLSPTVIDGEIAESEINHYTSCEDENRSECGIDLTGVRWVSEFEEVDCIVCLDLAEIHETAGGCDVCTY